jgi:predicted metalloprotease with PDZ domain
MPHPSNANLPTLSYRLGMAHPHTHLFQVELRVPAWPGEHVDLALPAWTPGAYKIVDNARNLRGFEAKGLDGQVLAYDRRDLHTWRIHHGGNGFTVTYQVFGDKMTIHQAQLNAQHAFVNGCMVFLYPVGGQHCPTELAVDAPAGWKVATGLEALGGNRFKAPTYDDLIDCPLELGDFQEAEFDVDGTPYRIVWNGPTPMDRVRLVDGLRKLIETETAFWGKAPYSSYTFIYNVTKDDYLNGLEHKNSTAIQGPIDLDRNDKGFFALTAHELFHVWNVKRLRPIGLGPFDYSRPAHTTALWVVEGLTEYYTDLMCLRAGITTRAEYLRGIADNLTHLEQSPGRQFTTLEQASFITWNFGDDRWNGAVNYYLKGSLAGLALDLEIRTLTGNEKSLDDVMRVLWERYGAPDLPYDPEEVEAVIEEVVGEPMGAFFDHHLRSTADTDWTEVFAKAGLRLVVDRETPALQARLAPKEGGMLIEDVRAQGAAEAAGLMAGDLLVAIGDRKATPALAGSLDTYFQAGSTLPVYFFRNDRLHAAEVRFGCDRRYAILPVEAPTPMQEEILKTWLNSPARVPTYVR